MPAELDPVIHAEARLRVMATLNALDSGTSIAFPRLRKLLRMTAGNLSTHLRKLEDTGYLSQSKTFEGRSPATYVEITSRGREAFTDYQLALRSLLTPTTEGVSTDATADHH